VNTGLSKRCLIGVLLSASFILVGGCSDPAEWFKTDRTRFLSPDKLIAPVSGSPINPILGSIGPTDRSQDVLPNATFPREGDWSYTDQDYIIGPTDIVDVSILDLFNEGLETVLRRQVSDSGYIDLPLIPDRIKAEGYTKEELKQVIINKYSPDILRNPTISVTVAAQRQNTFSVIGAVARPGTYSIMSKDMRLLEAIALAGGVTQVNINYIYVIRPEAAPRIPGPSTAGSVTGGEVVLPPEPKETPDGTGGTGTPTTAPGTGTTEDADKALQELGKALEGLLPGTSTKPTSQPKNLPAPSMISFSETNGSGGPASAPSATDPTTAPVGGAKWIYSAGKWVKAQGDAGQASSTTKPRADDKATADPFGWRKVDKSDMARVVAINLKQLRDGDPRMNIVMRDSDIVHIPTLEVGEFYISGEVSRPGVYSLTGRRITLKMAVAAAGNVGGLAWPQNSLLIRRIGNNQEQYIPVDLQAIFRGEDPDIFLKPNDTLSIGTDARASFFAVIRNAFRMTYGFGFIYDRNFADPQFYTPTSRRFTRW